ncbi:MAG: hypothetical protein C3F06_14075 [Candidatus Methanoperedenaceae archaeon]|nr:MAG: hypothetical protein C3F06_14075 [Candidatus Methanoperedenaceae archaeon]
MESTASVHTRQFRIHLFLAFLIDISVGIITVAIPLHLTTLDISSMEFGLIIGAASIGALLIKIPLGILSDKIGKKPLIYLGFLILFISNAFFPLYPDTIPYLRIAQGLAISLIWVPLTALFMETFRETGKIAYFSGAFMLGFLTGNLLGGLLPQFVGFTSTFLLSAGIIVLCVYILSCIDNPEVVIVKTDTGNKSNFSQLINAWLLGVSNVAALTIFLSFIPLFASRQLNYSPGQVGLLIFLEGITYVLLVVPMGRKADEIGKFRLLLMGNAGTLVVFSIFYFSNTFIELAFASIMFGSISALILPSTMSLAGESMSNKGKAMGIFQTSHDIGALIGPALAGAISAVFTIRHAFLAVIPIILLSFVLIIILSRKSKSKLIK